MMAHQWWPASGRAAAGMATGWALEWEGGEQVRGGQWGKGYCSPCITHCVQADGVRGLLLVGAFAQQLAWPRESCMPVTACYRLRSAHTPSAGYVIPRGTHVCLCIQSDSVLVHGLHSVHCCFRPLCRRLLGREQAQEQALRWQAQVHVAWGCL